ncbi:MAG: hypothetical protein R2867_01030 [Caldilineaceae bacterium]
MSKTSEAMNEAIRQAAGRMPAETAEPPQPKPTPRGNAGSGTGGPPPKFVNPTERMNNWLRQGRWAMYHNLRDEGVTT